MFKPNLFTVREGNENYGLHRFKDGVQNIAWQHSSGEWVNTMRQPTKEQIAYFEKHGTKAEDK